MQTTKQLSFYYARTWVLIEKEYKGRNQIHYAFHDLCQGIERNVTKRVRVDLVFIKGAIA